MLEWIAIGFLLSYAVMFELIKGAEIHIFNQYKIKIPLSIFFVFITIGITYSLVQAGYYNPNLFIDSIIWVVGFLLFFLVAAIYLNESQKFHEKNLGIKLNFEEACLFKYYEFKVFIKKAFIVIMVFLIVGLLTTVVFKSVLNNLPRPY